MTVVPLVYQEHCKNAIWQVRRPAWKETEEARERNDWHHALNLTRPRSLPEFVMDRLRHIIDKVSAQQFTRIDHILPSDTVAPLDNDLAQPWLEAWERSEALSKLGHPELCEELRRMKAHVEAAYEERTAIIKTYSSKPQRGRSSFTELPIEKRQDALRALSRMFHAAPTDLEYFDTLTASRLKASYAYIYDREKSRKHWSRFPFDVATRDICEIKARASGFTKTLAAEFYHWMTISYAFLRKFDK